MKKKYTMSVCKVETLIANPVTKFGGRPNWLSGVQWPLSKTTGRPMCFIGQFILYPELFGALNAQMAYLFMTEDGRDVYENWSPNSGENAVIVQPGEWHDPLVALTRMAPAANSYDLEEYEVILEPGEDPDRIDEDECRQNDEWENFIEKVYESKIGGAPAFLQFPEYPDEGNWMLIAQIASTLLPTELNFGDGGVGYVFLSEDGLRAKFLWQG